MNPKRRYFHMFLQKFVMKIFMLGTYCRRKPDIAKFATFAEKPTQVPEFFLKYFQCQYRQIRVGVCGFYTKLLRVCHKWRHMSKLNLKYSPLWILNLLRLVEYVILLILVFQFIWTYCGTLHKIDNSYWSQTRQTQTRNKRPSDTNISVIIKIYINGNTIW